MALSHKKLAAKRAKANLKRKNKTYTPRKYQQPTSVDQTVTHDVVKDTITL
jgi:hypothetical protein